MQQQVMRQSRARMMTMTLGLCQPSDHLPASLPRSGPAYEPTYAHPANSNELLHNLCYAVPFPCHQALPMREVLSSHGQQTSCRCPSSRQNVRAHTVVVWQYKNLLRCTASIVACAASFAISLASDHNDVAVAVFVRSSAFACH